MECALRSFDRACLAVIRLFLRLAVAFDDLRQRLPRRVRRWRGSLRRVRRRWLAGHRLAAPSPFARRRRCWNRTPEHLEEKLVRLHVEQPLIGAGQLRFLAERVLAFRPSRETVRRILIRRRDLVVALDQQRRRKPRRIQVTGARQLWGLDLTLVWLLGFIPVWILGAIDYNGSRIVALERLRWPSSREIARVLDRAFADHGKPLRVLTDRGPAFTSAELKQFLAANGVRSTLTRPAHPWTNGRIERLFKTFKQTMFGCVWLLASLDQIDRFAADFKTWHNSHRPHSSWGGRTPDEVWFRKPKRLRSAGRIAFFDGRLDWYRFA